MADDDRLRKRASFDEVAELYARARPRYPEVVIDDVVELAGFGPGCGSSRSAAGRARRRRRWPSAGSTSPASSSGRGSRRSAQRELAGYPNVRVINADVEHWEPDAAPYDGVVAFMAFHWVDPERRYEIAAGMLRPGGALAIASIHHVMPPDADPFYFDVQDDYRAVGMAGDEPPPPPGEIVYIAGEIDASGLFGPVAVRRREWEVVDTPDEHIALINTYSPHLLLPEEQRQELFDRIRRRIEARPGGTVRKSMLAVVQVAHLL